MKSVPITQPPGEPIGEQEAQRLDLVAQREIIAALESEFKMLQMTNVANAKPEMLVDLDIRGKKIQTQLQERLQAYANAVDAYVKIWG